MDILILGGTLFLGRHLAAHALAQGHRVTLFHRGRTNPQLFPDAQHLHGDRTGDLSALATGEWDAVIDTSGYDPAAVETSARLLAPRARHYTFISSISVYADTTKPGITEDAALAQLPPNDDGMLSNETYGARKAECEQVVMDRFVDRGLIIRPGLIVGPHDPTDRFTYWPVRIAQGGEVLIPDAPQAPVQWIDVRDLAQWTLSLIEAQATGVYNATGPAAPYTLEAFLTRCRDILAPQTGWIAVDHEFLLAQGVRPFADLPLWLPPDAAGLLAVDCRRAIAAGLTFRDLDVTIRDTHAWRMPTLAERPLSAGLEMEREREILAAWRSHLNRPAYGSSGRRSGS